MEFSTLTTASLHQTKTAALGIGVFEDGMLTNAADIINQDSDGAIKDILKDEFKAKAGSHVVLRNLKGVNAKRVVLIGLGKQENYKAITHQQAESVFAKYCVSANVKDAVSTLAANECTD